MGRWERKEYRIVAVTGGEQGEPLQLVGRRATVAIHLDPGAPLPKIGVGDVFSLDVYVPSRWERALRWLRAAPLRFGYWVRGLV